MGKTFEFITEYLTPVSIFSASDNLANTEKLLNMGDLQIGVSENNLCSVSGKGYIVLDFGKEYHGGARILVNSCSAPTVKVRLRFGESVSEAYAEIGEKGACNDHSLRDFETMLTAYSDMTFGQTGFRFLRIDFLEDQTLTIKNIYCAFTHRIFPKENLFNSNDGRIKDIFSVAKRTVGLCAQSYLWDGIKRDRLVWVGDAHPEMLALVSLYGKNPLIEDLLELTKKQYPLGTWMNNMPMYSAWWVIVLADYCLMTENLEFAQKHIDYAEGIIEQCSNHVQPSGELNFPAYFVDWQTHKKPDELAGCRALLTIMTNKFLQIAAKTGAKTKVARSLREKLNKIEMEVISSKQVIALKYFAKGEITEKERNLLLMGGAKGMSTFMSYYILKTIAETHNPQVAIDIMKEYYGAMLDKGATTFFEDFDIEWAQNSSSIDKLPQGDEKDFHGDFGQFCYKGFRHSLCHGWSAGIIKFIYEYCNE